MTKRDDMGGTIARGIGISLIAALVLVGNAFQARSEDLNILLLVADDLGWNDLPYFSPPVDWAKQPGAGATGTWNQAKDTSRRAWPEHNRFAGRAYACRDTTGPGCATIGGLGRFYWGEGASDYYTATAADFQYSTTTPGPTQYDASVTDCHATTALPHESPCTVEERRVDVLPGFGGLRRIADEGIVFPRFYANSSKCSPSRAALFTGRYPPRAGVTGNFADLKATEITIAEFLKQGCDATDDKELWCRTDGVPNSDNPGPVCPCYISPAAGGCASRTCYRTGLIGKWHLGGRSSSPWNQGFDEYFGFGGGSRDYFSVRDLQCGPVPNYCGGTGNSSIDDRKICSTNTDCVGQTNDFSCEPRGLYLGIASNATGTGGSKSENSCVHTDKSSSSSDCCIPKKKNGKAIGTYAVQQHYSKDRLSESPLPPDADGRDISSAGLRPCSANGAAEDANCAYFTRMQRDHAKGFMVRNAQFQPWFLVVSFHAPHFAFKAPLRTEDHFKTEIGTAGNEVKARSPTNATRYWAVMEEMDAAVGGILEFLEEKGVCENAIETICTEDADCAGTNNECIKLGRDGSTPCATGTSCKSPAQRTLVLFVSDHGRPHRGSDYGAPDLRGGKGDVFEGGIRVGLLAKHPNSPTHLCSHDGTPCDPQAQNPCGAGNFCDARATTHRGDSRVMASIVDLFPTIADAAGYTGLPPNPVLDSAGRLNLKVCRNATQSGCTTSADCPANEPCDSYVIDGKSFLRAMVDVADPLAPPTSPTTWRDFVYASYKSDGKTIVSADDWQPSLSGDRGVCAYEVASGSRRVLGSSCNACSVTTPCDGTDWCKLPGRVCVSNDEDDYDVCDGNLGQPSGGTCLTHAFDQGDPAKALYPCKHGNNECPQGSNTVCKADVYIQCNRCETEPAWKLKAPKNAATAGAAKGLFELKTNPTEEDALDCQGKGPDSDLKISEELFDDDESGKLKKWQTCMDNKDTCVDAY